MAKRKQLRGFDLRALKGCRGAIGVDEAGRGALAGPVVAAAVVLPAGFYRLPACRRLAAEANDSKQLNVNQRQRIHQRMMELAAANTIGLAWAQASVLEIDALNILGATSLAMRRALEGVLARCHIRVHLNDPLFASTVPDPPKAITSHPWPETLFTEWRVWVDGLAIRSLGYEHTPLVEGDAKSLAIALASILAKVERDQLMRELEPRYPGYQLARHKGYATREHCQALETLGPTSEHRPLFLRRILAQYQKVHEEQATFPFL